MKISLKGYPILLLVIVVALVIAFVLGKSKSPPNHDATGLEERAVEVIVARELPFRASVTAYGNVEPAITLHSMAEVSGKISYLHPNLKTGETIPAGTTVIRIDAKDYAVSLGQTQADLEASRSSLSQLNEEEKSTRRSLELAEKNLKVGEAEYQRITDVFKKGLVAKSVLDAEEQKLIQLRQQREELKGKMNGYDSRRQSVLAQIARAEKEVENRKTVLERTEITLPFDARIGAVNVEKDEFVAVGAVLYEAVDLQGVEITAQLPMDSMSKLVSHMEGKTPDKERILRPGGRVNERLNLSARVSLVNGMHEATWEATVLRISDAIDATRQTLGIVVGVEKPYEKIIPGRRPPLIKGMYTAVEIFAPERPALIIPRRAIHQGRVYVADEENQLAIRPVDVQLLQGDLAVIRSGIQPGERVIVTDLVAVIAQMPLTISTNEKLERSLAQRAAGGK